MNCPSLFNAFYDKVINTVNFSISQPITESEAKKLYWALGDRYWMQIVDGEFHKFGQSVFDEGLHGGVKEPGFLASLRAGCEFASQHLTEKPSMLFYKDLHKVLCAHFKGKENQTEMIADKAGNFRNDVTGCRPSLLFDVSGIDREKIFMLKMYEDCYFCNPKRKSDERVKELLEDFFGNLKINNQNQEKWIEDKERIWMNKTDLDSKIRGEYPSVYAHCQEALKEIKERIPKINVYIKEIAKEIGEEPFVKLSKLPNSQRIDVDYLCRDQDAHDRIVQKLFNRYNQKIDSLNALLSEASIRDLKWQGFMDKKIEAIAELYQVLEWLHPFQDGQGRTDLVLLSKLLVDEGFNPVILKNPYMSTTALPEEWVNYLKNGMQCWKDVAF